MFGSRRDLTTRRQVANTVGSYMDSFVRLLPPAVPPQRSQSHRQGARRSFHLLASKLPKLHRSPRRFDISHDEAFKQPIQLVKRFGVGTVGSGSMSVFRDGPRPVARQKSTVLVVKREAGGDVITEERGVPPPRCHIPEREGEA